MGIEIRLGAGDSLDRGLLVVQDVTKNGPAYNGGIRALDRISAIDDVPTSAQHSYSPTALAATNLRSSVLFLRNSGRGGELVA